jgi:predicted nucleotide-binding protein (sugar kinase/HSP70/actin superfamily)
MNLLSASVKAHIIKQKGKSNTIMAINPETGSLPVCIEIKH